MKGRYTVKGYVKAMRLPVVILAALLAIASFRISAWDPSAYLVAVSVVVVSSAIMAQNDLRDRHHDMLKGKRFALAHTRQLRKFVFALWVLSCVMALGLRLVNPMFGLISLATIGLGLVYSETRRIPLLTAIIVTATYASATLYA